MPNRRLNTAPVSLMRAVQARDSVMHLQCPFCGEEALFIGVPAFDRRVTCSKCGATPEVRHAHEAWCAGRRSELSRRFPELGAMEDNTSGTVTPLHARLRHH